LHCQHNGNRRKNRAEWQAICSGAVKIDGKSTWQPIERIPDTRYSTQVLPSGSLEDWHTKTNASTRQFANKAAEGEAKCATMRYNLDLYALSDLFVLDVWAMETSAVPVLQKSIICGDPERGAPSSKHPAFCTLASFAEIES